MTLFPIGKEEFVLEGQMPERALLRLRRAHISLFCIKKIEKNQILFRVNRKDSEKVFAIFRSVCYNSGVCSAYTIKSHSVVGVGKYVEQLKRRVGLLLGGLLCIFLWGVSQPLLFSIEFVGTDIYAREGVIALEEAGIRPFAPYQSGKEDWVIAQLLAIPDVEYVSLQKVGHRLVVETRLSPFPKREIATGKMYAKHSGKLVAMTVLRGTPLVNVGEEMQAGDCLVDDAFQTEEGGHVRVEIIARVRIACTHEGIYPVETAEEAFAHAYLQLEDVERIIAKDIEKTAGGYRVKIAYEVIETMNLY
ncbi:MAG: sporulation protein YqfD [Clostridia bacterium]|nr:sporulation protein YqfD [Clostridia bacterium]